MFSKRLASSARFLKMPISSQALYFHLGLHADDDGVVEAYNVIKMLGCTEDDLRVLVAKDLVKVLNEDLVSYITDWKENNIIRPDRKIDSIYKDLLISIVPDVELIEPRKRADVQKIEQRTTNGQPMDNQRTTNGRHKLSKDKLSKDKTTKWFESEEVNKVFKEFLEMRKKIKSPMTEYAIKRMVNKVNKLSGSSDAVAVEILNKSIDCGWKDVYPLKDERPINQKAQELEQLNNMGFEWARGGSDV